MKNSVSATGRATPLAARLLIGFIVVLFLTRNLPWHLDDYDQAKQAFTSFEMVEQGHWWFQHTPTGRVATKPPLAGWISAGIYYLTGRQSWDLAWRIPSLVSALILLAVLWYSGRILLGGSWLGGVLAAGAFGLNTFTPRLATLVRTDMMLTLLIFLPGWMIWRKVRDQTPWTAQERWILFLALLGSMMTKGPIAYAFLLPGLVVFSILTRRFGMQNFAWSGAVSWFAPLAFFGAWAYIGTQISPEFYEQVVLKEFLGRFTVGEKAVHNNQIIVFYFGHLLTKFAPWSLLILAFASVQPVRRAFRADPELLWLACWSLGGLILMSLVPSKRFDRILPVVPPLCLLLVAMARHLPDLRLGQLSLHKLALYATVAAASISGGYVGWSVWNDFKSDQSALVRFGRQVAAATAGRREKLAVVSGKDEGMLLYTGKTSFTRHEDTLERWKQHTLDAVVLPEKIFEKHGPDFAPFELLAKAPKVPGKGSGYLLLQRSVPSLNPLPSHIAVP